MNNKQLTKTDLRLIRKVMEEYAQTQWALVTSLPKGSKRNTAGKNFNTAALISRYKLKDV